MKTLEYLAGFVSINYIQNFVFQGILLVLHNQYCLILHACEVENDDTQALVNVRDRGELWKVWKKCKIFLWNVRSRSGQNFNFYIFSCV